MNRCYLSLGSNQKVPERQLRRAIDSLGNLPHTHITKVSSFFWSKAWGLSAQQDFCNVVVELFTTLPPSILLNKCQIVEKRQGRVRKKIWGPRTIDIDIIFYANRKITLHNLIIPHPYFRVREFVTKPLIEINSKLIPCFIKL